jgi:regulator of protease activity HflC (stomatin/prohibitin superfamily)
MGWFITALILLGIAVIAFIVAGVAGAKLARGSGYEEDNRLTRGWGIGVGVVLTAIGALFIVFATTYTQDVGESKVIINLDGTVVGQDTTPGFGTKAPWQEVNNWDIFSQEVTYAGNENGSPDYTDGSVSGQEVSTSVANGARANLDISIVYSIDGDAVEKLYREFRSQERFTKQVIEKTILSTIRDIPTGYSAVEFRGDKRGEAQDKMLKELNSKLNKLGVQVDFVNLQNVRYTEEVEQALKQVEVAEQEAKKAEAELRATEISAQAAVVKAKADADALRAKAQGEADANATLNASLTPSILQQRYLDTLATLAAEGNLVITDGTGSQVLVQR